MSGKPNDVREPAAARPVDRRAVRHAATLDQILAAAQALMAERGLAALSLRELGAAVGMRAQSLYSYVASKNEIYDALFRRGWDDYRAMQIAAESTAPASSDRAAFARHLARAHVSWCVADPVRYQLLFWRTVPGFEPSAASWAASLAAFEVFRGQLARIGIREEAQVDLATALFAGLVSQQLANDPGGDRFQKLVDPAVDLLISLVPSKEAEPA
jgi:AcrR family transcriptional regulator